MKNATKKTTNQAVCYLRTSTNKQDLSAELQLASLKAYCTLHKLEIVAVIEEPDQSATKDLDKRPEGQKLSRLLAAGAGHVVALKLDRLFRSAKDALVNVETWDKDGISLHLVDMGGQSINTGSSMGKMMFTMLAGFAEFERNLIAERTTAALQHKKATGRVYGNAPYGLDAVDGKLIVNQAEQVVLADIKRMRDSGMSYNGIANQLNAQGIPAKRGGEWHSQSVKTVLETAA